MDKRIFGKVVGGQVELPSEGRIEVLELLTLITDAICPALEIQKGSAAIVGRLLPDGDGTAMPLVHDAKSREFLDEILPDLPEIAVRSTEADRKAFLKAYRQHPRRKAWEPRIADSWDIDRNREERTQIREAHQQKLSELVAAGRIGVMTWQGLQAEHVRLDSYLSVKDARGYLAPTGLLAEQNVESAVDVPVKRARRPSHDYTKEEIESLRAFEEEHGRAAMRRQWSIGAETVLKLLGPTNVGKKRQETKVRRAQASPFQKNR